MKSLLNIKRRITTALFATTAILTGALMQSCDAIYDDLPPCEGKYLVELRFTNNMMEVDAFASRVPSVTLLVYDKAGNLVTSKTESGVALQREHYTMAIDVEPGTYDLVAWCGLENNNAFSLTGGDAPAKLTDAVCVMSRETEDGQAVSKKQLSPLFHAMNTNVKFPEGDLPQDVLVTVMDLIKDTNSIVVMLTDYNGKRIDPDDFSFYITDDNGKMNYDNSLMSDETITYREWYKKDLPTITDDDNAMNAVGNNSSIKIINSMKAELDVARLTTDHNPRLTVRVKGKENPVISLPIRDLLIESRNAVNSNMSAQRYLDCQDQYNMIFFLSDKDGWYFNGEIYINGWHVMYQNPNL